MKKMLCFLLCLTLIFSSVSLCFATAQDVSDATTHTQLGNIYNLLNGTNFSGRLANIYNRLTDINANLVELMGWLDPDTGGSSTALLQKIVNALTYVTENSGLGSFVADLWQTNSVNLPYIYNLYTLDNVNGFEGQAGGTSVTVFTPAPGGSYVNSTINFSRNGWRTSVATMLLYINNNLARAFRYQNDIAYTSYGSTQSAVNWLDLTSISFTPNSSTNGLYQWLSNIQTPVARLSYVLASDERIEAQEAAAANEEAVVDNFIDSSGDGYASPSDIGSVSNLSSGYKNNFGSDATVTGIFNIFDSNNMGWFSQETKNQLDTTTPTRLTKGSQSETPLLDKQIEDIYDALGVKQP